MGLSQAGARAFRRTTTGDFFDKTTDLGGTGVRMAIMVVGIRLTPAAAAATAQITDANGTVLADLSAAANGNADWFDVPTVAEGKVTLAALSGAGASVMVYIQ